MSTGISYTRGLLVALLAAAGAQAAGAAAVALEQRLHAERPEILRWETQPIETSAPAPRQADIAVIGRIGPRTPVRFTDGRVRWFAVVGMGQVMTTVHGIEAGTALSANDLVPAERDVIALGCEPLTALAPDKRWRATRRLATGDALCRQWVEPAPDVARGDKVVLSTQHGAISASRVLVAGSDAFVGERVRLRDPLSGDALFAIATGTGTARDLNSQEPK